MTATARTFTQEEQALLDRVRDAVREIEPDATIVLYGSRARGDHVPDSDWDLLILLDGDVSRKRERAVQDCVYDVEFETDAMLSVVVRSKDEWETRLFRAKPFHTNVERDGILLEPGGVSFGWERTRERMTTGEDTVDLSAERDELIQLELARARETLIEADAMANISAWNTCVNRLYYACFYAATALLLRDGRSAAKHSGVQSMLNRYYVHTGIIAPNLGDLYNHLFEQRNTADYNIRVRFDEATVRPLIPDARRLVERVAALLQSREASL